MYNPESVLVNETHNILWDFEIWIDHLILIKTTRRSDSQPQQQQKREPAG